MIYKNRFPPRVKKEASYLKNNWRIMASCHDKIALLLSSQVSSVVEYWTGDVFWSLDKIMCLNLNIKNYSWAYELKNLSLENTEINYLLLEVDRLLEFIKQ